MTDWITLSDVIYLLKRRKKGLIVSFLVAFCLAFILFCYRMPTYLGTAQFQDTPSSASSMKEKLVEKAQGAASPFYKGKALIWMQSSTLLKEVIYRHGLQIQLKPKGWIKRLYKGVEAHFFPLRNVHEQEQLNNIAHVEFAGVRPFYFTIKPLQTGEVEVEGKTFSIPTRVDLGNVCFDLLGTIDCPLHLVVEPLDKAVLKLKRQLKLSSSKVDPNVIQMALTMPSYQKSQTILNAIMREYQTMLKRDLSKMIDGQIGYLNERKREMFGQFEAAIKEHVDHFQGNIQAHGFMTTDEWIKQKGALETRFEERLEKLKEQIESAKFAKESNMFIPAESGLWSRSLDLQTKKEGVQLPQVEQSIMRLESEKKALEKEINQVQENVQKCREETFDLALLEKMPLVEKGVRLQSQLGQKERYSAKEIERAQNELKAIRLQISDQLTQRSERLKTELAHTLSVLDQESTRYQEQLKKEEAALTRQNSALLDDQIASMESEIAFIEQKRSAFQTELKHIPSLWKSETLLKLKSDLHYSTLESLASFVEAKSVEHHLIPIEARPIELGFARKKPHNFFPLINATLWALLSTFIAIASILAYALMHRVPVAMSTLKKMGAKAYRNSDRLGHALFIEVGEARLIGVFEKGGRVTQALIKAFEKRNEEVQVIEDFDFSAASLAMLQKRTIIATQSLPTDPEMIFANRHFDCNLMLLSEESYRDLEPFIQKGIFIYQR